jgi:hypothetical protein
VVTLKIKEGDHVDIYFFSTAAEHNVKVLSLPDAAGGCWNLQREDGTLINVMFFDKMVQIQKSAPTTYRGICDVCGAVRTETAPNTELAIMGLVIQGWATDGSVIYCPACDKKRKELKR